MSSAAKNEASNDAAGGFVRFENVQKSYDGEILVVKDLNLDIPQGEFLTMLGPSGSGKTTCLMMLAGFEPATHGEIYLNGQSINNVPPNKRGIGMVFLSNSSYGLPSSKLIVGADAPKFNDFRTRRD